MTLSTDNIIQLYAPLAGLLVLTFWSGILTQKVADLVRRVLALETSGTSDVQTAVELGRLDERMKALETVAKQLDMHVTGMQRSLANMTSGKQGAITTFGGTP